MDRNEMLQSVERNATTVIGKGQSVLNDAAIRGARAASQTLDRVHPVLDEALDRVTPLADATVKKVAPAVEEVLTRIPPSVDAARGVIQEDLLPHLSEALTVIAHQPLSKEVRSSLVAASAAVNKELEKSVKSKKKMSWGKRLGLFALIGAAIGAVAVAVKKALEPPDAGWVTHAPDDAYIADPLVDEATAGEAASAAEDGSAAAAENVAAGGEAGTGEESPTDGGSQSGEDSSFRE